MQVWSDGYLPSNASCLAAKLQSCKLAAAASRRGVAVQLAFRKCGKKKILPGCTKALMLSAALRFVVRQNLVCKMFNKSDV